MKLYAKTAILIGSVFLAFTLAAVTLLYRSENRHIEAEGMAHAETLNRTIFEALYATMRQGGDRLDNRAVVERLRQIEGIHELRLIHGPSVDRQFGVEPDEQPQDDLDRRALAGETVREVQWHRGVRVVRYVMPVLVEAECQRCHQAEVGEVNGAIAVHVSLEASDRALAARRNALLGGVIAGLLGLGLVTFWEVQRMVVRPVERIQAGAAALAAGDLDHRLELAGDDEIGTLADAFNGMAERVQASHDHLEDQVHQRTQALLALNAVLTATSSSLNLDEVYRAFVEEIRKMVDFDRSSITVFEPGGQAFTSMVVATRDKTEVGPGFRGERTPIMDWIITRRRPRIDADLATMADRGPVAETLLQEGLRSWMLVPILFRGEVVGAINFASRQVGTYTEADGERLLPIAGQLGVALENARLYEETRRLSLTDDLTGLANRRAFDARLAEEIRRVRRYDRPLALLMADIDHFKRYNDTYGHPQGDVVLQELAGVLRSAVRDTDFVARYGGEEFVVILPETDGAGALEVAEKVRAAVAAHPFPRRESQPGGRLTISLGVAPFSEDLPEPMDLIQLADQALYRAKREGRNRVLIDFT